MHGSNLLSWNQIPSGPLSVQKIMKYFSILYFFSQSKVKDFCSLHQVPYKL
jgi:hypothetical protein